ncbi:hypothetical protein [Paenibacillus sp. WLX2291]|uniref:hypothetical protein n=1 Tax=Paenibacillus sp. WLX2291 TaxID=3296934 RepID=UPI003983F2C2
MDCNEQTLIDLTNAFLKRIKYNDFVAAPVTLVDLRNIPKKEQNWSKKAGVYYFLQNDIVKYVGRATPNVGLGIRVYQQANAWGGHDGWDNVISDPNTTYGLIIFEDREDWHWLAALEVLLIDKLRPQFNKRF